MNIILKSCNGLVQVPCESRLLMDRKLFIEGEITAQTASEFEKSLMILIKEDKTKPIDVYISSPGGEITAGMQIYDAIQGHKSIIHLHGRGTVASMAAILLASGEKGHRSVNPHAKIMIHEPLLAGGLGGSATSIRKTAESILETKAMTVKVLAESTGRPESEIEEAISYDHYMNANEAILFGIADFIETSIV